MVERIGVRCKSSPWQHATVEKGGQRVGDGERRRGRKRERWRERERDGTEWRDDLPHSLNALLMTAKGESALEIGEEELPVLYRLPSYK